jgi:putative transcriptional regulator
MDIKELCARYGLKQTELARRFGIPLRTVQDWYSGKRTPPDYVVGMIIRLLELEK